MKTGKQAVGAACRLKKKFKNTTSLDLSKMRMSDRKDRNHAPSKDAMRQDSVNIARQLADLDKVKKRAKKRRRSEASRSHIIYFYENKSYNSSKI